MDGNRDHYELLIADDDAAFRATLEEVFEPFFHTIAVESGEDAIEVVKRRAIDVILLDYNMHLLTGIETLRIVKEIRFEVPCILISANVTESLRFSAAQEKAFSVLQKPVTRRELVNTVSCAFSNAYHDAGPFAA